MKKKYYEMTISGTSADINIYGDITSWPWLDSDVSAFNLKQEIDGLDVDTINVYINSYGGEVAEALAIYSSLKRNKATVKTYCDGFACSAATIIFAAGDEREMGSIALLMIHNAWTCASGNAASLRKAADDIEKITQSSIDAYKKILNISEDEIKELMDNETWITAEEALNMGFATSIADAEDGDEPTQSVKSSVREMILSGQKYTEVKILEKLDDLLAIVQKGDDPDNLDEGEQDLDDDSEDNPDDGESDEENDNSEQKSNAKVVAFFNALTK